MQLELVTIAITKGYKKEEGSDPIPLIVYALRSPTLVQVVTEGERSAGQGDMQIEISSRWSPRVIPTEGIFEHGG